MQTLLPAALAAALLLAPAAASAQVVVGEPPMATGAMTAEDAAAIAMMNGIVVVEDVDLRWWDGNYEVEGTGPTGEDLEITIDPATGAVLDIDS